MVVDSSAIVAILLREPDADTMIDAIDRADDAAMSAVNALECRMVLSNRVGAGAYDQLERLFAAKPLAIVPFASRRPHQLSGGQRQRVALGRAMDDSVAARATPRGSTSAIARPMRSPSHAASRCCSRVGTSP